MLGWQWMSWQTHWGGNMDVGEEAIIRLEAHEKECLVRYENIQDTLNRHHERFDKLESKAESGFQRIEKIIMWGGGIMLSVVSLLITVFSFLQ